MSGVLGGIRTPGLLLRRQLLYPAELQAQIGADEGNRTLVISLEGWNSTIELHPHKGRPKNLLDYRNTKKINCQGYCQESLRFFSMFLLKKDLTNTGKLHIIYNASGCSADGSALPWGGRGRGFKSRHSDQQVRSPKDFALCLFAGVIHW